MSLLRELWEDAKREPLAAGFGITLLLLLVCAYVACMVLCYHYFGWQWLLGYVMGAYLLRKKPAASVDSRRRHP